MKDIFLSDIHIGNDSPTNLYRISTDQAILKLILQDIQRNHRQIRNLVILGDWLDLWMYPASITPPTVEQIMDANPQLFTKQLDNSGDFVTCLDSIQGTIHYINGNHDITVTSKQLNDYFKKSSLSKKEIICTKYYTTDQIHGEHGHNYSMVCKPYKNEPIPLGYFITRAGMQILVNTKPNMQTILKSQKSLPPIDVIAIQELISYNNLTFAQAMLTTQANQMNLALKDLIFTMPDNTTINAEDVANKFPNLSIDNSEFLRTDIGGSLNRSAFELGAKNRKIIIFGHTHIKELQAYGKNYIYGNIGFMCANEPNQNGIPVSSYIEIDEHYISLIKINHDSSTIAFDKTFKLNQFMKE